MNKIILIILLTVSTNVFPNSYYTGEKLFNVLKLDKSTDIAFVLGYISAAVDGMEGDEFASKYICLPSKISPMEILELTYKHMQKYQNQLKDNAASAVVLALMEAYPCKK